MIIQMINQIDERFQHCMEIKIMLIYKHMKGMILAV